MLRNKKKNKMYCRRLFKQFLNLEKNSTKKLRNWSLKFCRKSGNHVLLYICTSTVCEKGAFQTGKFRQFLTSNRLDETFSLLTFYYFGLRFEMMSFVRRSFYLIKVVHKLFSRESRTKTQYTIHASFGGYHRKLGNFQEIGNILRVLAETRPKRTNELI